MMLQGYSDWIKNNLKKMSIDEQKKMMKDAERGAALIKNNLKIKGAM